MFDKLGVCGSSFELMYSVEVKSEESFLTFQCLHLEFSKVFLFFTEV